MEERGRAKAKGRPNRLMAKVAAAATASWIGELGMSWIGWVGELGVSEGKRETGREREKETVLITNNKKQ